MPLAQRSTGQEGLQRRINMDRVIEIYFSDGSCVHISEETMGLNRIAEFIIDCYIWYPDEIKEIKMLSSLDSDKVREAK